MMKKNGEIGKIEIINHKKCNETNEDKFIKEKISNK
jgi:hypothetical protein